MISRIFFGPTVKWCHSFWRRQKSCILVYPSRISDQLLSGICIILNKRCFIYFSDPQCWSQRDVVIWMRAKMQEFKIPNDSHMRAMEWLTAANIDGPGFVQIPEEEFKARLPEVFISFFYYLISYLLTKMGVVHTLQK